MRIEIAAIAASLTFGCFEIQPSNAKRGDSATKAGTTTDAGEGPSQLDPLGLTGKLQTFQNCSEVETYIEAFMTKEAEQAVQLEIDAAERFKADIVAGREVGVGVEAVPVSDLSAPTTATEAKATTEGGGEGAPAEYTTTNNQVLGIEEPDLVKNNGTHIFHISRGSLHVIQSWPVSAIVEIASIKLSGIPFDMLFDDANKSLTVLSRPVQDQKNDAQEIAPQTEMLEAFPQVDIAASSGIDMTSYDVTDPAHPKLGTSYHISGDYLSSRRSGDAIRVIATFGFSLPPEVQSYAALDPSFWEQGRLKPSKIARLQMLEKQLKELQSLGAANKAKIASYDLNYWLRTEGTGQPDRNNCSKFYAPAAATQYGLTRILTFNTKKNTSSETVLLAGASQVYSSAESLYLANEQWGTDGTFPGSVFTWIHKFDLKDSDSSSYVGTGRIEGTLLNQFAMDEFEGNLRVALTANTTENRTGSVNRVEVLAPTSDGKLAAVGRTPDLAKGESIYSVRFHGARGFVVTFLQVDPLYTLDLSDPKNPLVVSELKVPGYSSYIHLLDANHLLTIGRDGGLKLSIFDVKDAKAPKELYTHIVAGDAVSEAEWNHKAFTYYPTLGLLAVPVTGTAPSAEPNGVKANSGMFSGLMVFKLDVNAGISERGLVTFSDMYQGEDRGSKWWYAGAVVERSIFADQYLYGISNFGIRTVKVDEIKTPVATVRYSCDKTCYSAWPGTETSY